MMPKILLALAFLGLAALPLEAQDSGLRTIPATEGFAATLVKLEKAIKSGGHCADGLRAPAFQKEEFCGQRSCRSQQLSHHLPSGPLNKLRQFQIGLWATRTTRAGFTTASFQLLEKPATSVTSSAFFGSQMGFYWLRLAYHSRP